MSTFPMHILQEACVPVAEHKHVQLLPAEVIFLQQHYWAIKTNPRPA